MSIRMPLGRLAGRLAQHQSRTAGFSAKSRATTLPRIARQHHQHRPYSSEPPRPNNPGKVKFWPFFAIIGLGTAGYVALVNRRKGEFLQPRLLPWLELLPFSCVARGPTPSRARLVTTPPEQHAQHKLLKKGCKSFSTLAQAPVDLN